MENQSSVIFPCIHLKHGGELNKVTCFVNNKLKGTVSATGLQGSVLEKIITASRHDEHSEEVTYKIFARVQNPNFHGRSYELAFAVADKLSRYNLVNPQVQYFATGVIKSNQSGKVSAIEGINEKLSLMLPEASPGDVIFLPVDNVDDNDSQQKEILDVIKSKGVKLFSIESTDELLVILRSFSTDSTSDKKASNIRFKYALSVMLMLGVVFSVLVNKHKLFGEDIKSIKTTNQEAQVKDKGKAESLNNQDQTIDDSKQTIVFDKPEKKENIEASLNKNEKLVNDENKEFKAEQNIEADLVEPQKELQSKQNTFEEKPEELSTSSQKIEFDEPPADANGLRPVEIPMDHF